MSSGGAPPSPLNDTVDAELLQGDLLDLAFSSTRGVLRVESGGRTVSVMVTSSVSSCFGAGEGVLGIEGGEGAGGGKSSSALK